MEEEWKEIWKDIPGYEGMYQVSNYRRVKSLKRSSHKLLNPNDYGAVTLYKDNNAFSCTAESLFNFTFKGIKIGKRTRFKRLPYKKPTPEIQFIINKVCEYYKISEFNIQSLSRKGIINEARQIIHYICDDKDFVNRETLAHMVGGRDRTTINNSVIKVSNLLLTNAKYRNRYNDICILIGEKFKEPIKTIIFNQIKESLGEVSLIKFKKHFNYE